MKQHETSYWPHMILGFLLIGITLGYWTVKSAKSLPVNEERAYMMKYREADGDINRILQAQERFDARYRVHIEEASFMRVKVYNSKTKKEEKAVVLRRGINRFAFRIDDLEGKAVSDMNVSFHLTRPHTNANDVYVAHVPFRDGFYRASDINVTAPGRYILELKAAKGDAVGYIRFPAYLAP